MVGFSGIGTPSFAQLEELPTFRWEQHLQVPPISSSILGKQVLHFKTVDKPYTRDANAVKLVEEELQGAKELDSDAGVLRFGSDAVTLDGAYIELGVCTGKTINFIAALNPNKIIYGFDSFEGLPEDWVRQDKVIKKGTFGFKEDNFTPPALANVKFYKGWFKDSLPEYVINKLKETPIAFLHVDSDIYSSSREALEIFQNNIVPGTVIVFDEYFNYPGFENHEYKAFMEFLSLRKLRAEYLAYNKNHEQVAIRIVE